MDTCQTINSTPEINDIMVDGHDNVGTTNALQFDPKHE